MKKFLQLPVVLLLILSCGQRVDNPLLDVKSRSAAGGDVMPVIIDTGDGLLTSEDMITPVTDTFSVKLGAQPTGDITIGPIVSQNTAEVLVVQSSLTFTAANWDTWQTVTVMGVDDALTDGLTRTTVDIGTVQGTGYQATPAGKVVVFNMDDEAPLTPGVTLKAGTINYVSESGLTSGFEVSLNSVPASSVTISLTVSDAAEGTFAAPFTGSTGTLTFTAANWFLPQTVTAAGVDDSVADGNRAFTVITGTTVSLDPKYNGMFNPPDVAFINIDDDKPGVTVTPLSTAMISETGTTATFTMFLNSKPSANVTFNVSTSDPTEGTITTPFAGNSGVITFTPADWNIPQTVTVQGVDDALTDGNQPFSIIIGASASADPAYSGTFDPADLTVITTDNDVSGGVTVSAGSTMLVAEGGITSAFEIVLNSAPTANVTFNISTSDPLEGTITFPFAGNSGTITFTPANWNTPQTITVSGVEDSADDGNMPFVITVGASVSADPVYSGTFGPFNVNFINADNDSAGVTVNAGSSLLVSESGTSSSFQVVLNSSPSANVTLNVSTSDNSEGTITAPFVGDTGAITFTPGNWNVPQTVTVKGVDDFEADGNQSFTIIFGATSSGDAAYNGTFTPAPVSFTNVDNDSPGVTVKAGSSMLVSESGTTSSFEVVLNSAPTANVAINVSTSDATEGTITAPFAGASGTLTFSPGNWNVPQTVTVAGVDDFQADGNQTFTIVLAAAVSGDGSYNGINPPDVNFICIDDDLPGVTVKAGTSMLVSEGGTASSFQVVLNSAPTASVDITVSTTVPTEGTITAPFAGNSGIITFTTANWNIPQTITVTGVNDNVADGNQLFNIIVSAASSADTVYNGNFGPTSVSFINVDNDTAGVTVLAGSSMLVSESGGLSSFQVVLNSAPTANVTMNVSTSAPTEGTITAPFAGASGTLTFTPGNWNVAQTVTVAGVDDFAADGNQSFSIIFGSTSSGDPVYNGTFTPAPVSFINVDNETPGVTVSAGSLTAVSESGTTASFEVVLNSRPTGNVMINVSTSDPLEGTIIAPFAGNSGTLTFTNANWSTPQTVTVQGVNDNVADGNKAFTVVLATTVSGDIIYNGTFNPPDVNFINIDNDIAALIVLANSSSLVSEGGGTSSFLMVLASQPTANVTVDVSTSDPSEGTIISPSAGDTITVTFTPGNWNIPQTVTVQGVDDAEQDGNQAFLINIGTTVSADPVYSGTFGGTSLNFTNIDNDKAGVTVSGVSSSVVSESGTTATFQIVLNSRPTGNVNINLSTSDPTEGTIITPFIGNAGTVTFTGLNWNVPQVVTVQGVDDGIIDGNQPFTIVIGATVSGDPNYNGTFDPPDKHFVNTDNDNAGVTVQAGSQMMVSENGTVTSSFQVVLNSAPTANVTMSVSTSDNTEGTIMAPFVGDTGTVTFTPGNWNIVQTITVRGVDDNVADGTQPFTIIFGTTASGDPIYNGTFTPAPVSFICVDNDAPGITVNR